MCPYFWSFIGTLFLIPFITLARLLRVPSKSIGEFVTKQLTACKEFSKKRHDAREKVRNERKETLEKANISIILPYYKAYLRDRYDLVKAKELVAIFVKMKVTEAWFKNYYANNLYPELGYYERQALSDEATLYIHRAHELINDDDVKTRMAMIKQHKMKIEKVNTVIKETKEHPIIKYILMILMFLTAGTLIITLGWLTYAGVVFVIPYLKYIFIALFCIAIVVGLGFLVFWFLRCWGKEIMDVMNAIGEMIYDFFAFIFRILGKFFSKFKPIVKVFLIFVWIKNSFEIIIGTIKALYQKHCPLITWVERKN